MKEPWQDNDESDLKTGEPIHDGMVEVLIKMKEEMGADAFNDFAIRLATHEEKDLRKRKPDHPLLKLLDAHRAREENGFF